MADGIKIGSAFVEISGDTSSLVEAQAKALQEQKDFLQRQGEATAKATGVSQKAAERAIRDTARLLKALQDQQLRELVQLENQKQQLAAQTLKVVQSVEQTRVREQQKAADAQIREAKRAATEQERETKRTEAAAARASATAAREAKKAADAQIREAKRAAAAAEREDRTNRTSVARFDRVAGQVIRSNAVAERRAEAQAERELAAEIKKREQAQNAAARSSAQFAQSIRGQFAEAGKALLGFGTIASTVTVAAITLRNVITSIAEATAEQQQAQFAVNELYGKQAPAITKNAEALANYAKVSKTEALQASASVATLARNYALSGEQINKTLKITADLAAIRGISLSEASTRVESALRGEAESIEYLGQSLQSGALQSLAKMTDEQRKYFETLSPITKAQIILNALQDQTADLTGAAARRAGEAQGKFGALNAAFTDLAATTGGKLASSLGQLAGDLATVVKVAENLVKLQPKTSIAELGLVAAEAVTPFGLWAIAAGAVAAQLERIVGAKTRIGTPSNNINLIPGMSTEQITDIEESRTAAARRAADEQDRVRGIVDRAKKNVAILADAEEVAAKRAAKIKDEAIEAEIIRLEVEKKGHLDALEVRERATIRTIEAENRADEKAHEAKIERLEREKAIRIRAAEEARDQALRAEEVSKRQQDLDRENEDRSTKDQREKEDRSIADRRDKEDQDAEKAHRSEQRRLEARHEARVDFLEEEATKEKDAQEKRERNIESEIQKLRDASKERTESIQKAIQDEDDRHRKRIQNLEDEQDQRLEEIDNQIKLLDLQEKTEESAKREAGIRRKITDTEKDLIKAKGTGDPQAIAAATSALQAAIRRNDQLGTLAARKALDTAAGTGNPEEIAKLEQELDDNRAELVALNQDRERDAAKAILEAKKDAIKEETEDRKRQEDEDNRRRERELRADIDAEEKKLQARVRALEKRKQKSKDTSDDELRDIKKRRDAEDQAYEDAREQEDDRYREAKERLDKQREFEDRERTDRNTKEDREREDRRTKEDDALKDRIDAIRQNFDDEKLAAEEHYNGPNGLVTQAKKAADAAKEINRLRLDDAKQKFKEEREAIEAVYKNEYKNGLIDLQNEAKKNNADTLSSQLAAITSWKDSTNKILDENASKWKTVKEAIEAVTTAIQNIPDTGGTGSSAAPSSNRNGSQKGSKPSESGGSSSSGGSSGSSGSGGSSSSSGGSSSGGSSAPSEPPEQGQAPSTSNPEDDQNQAYGPIVTAASSNSYWTGGGTHAGPNGEDWPAADIFAEAGTPIYAPVAGRSSPAYSDKLSGYYTILYGNDGRAYYFAHGKVPFEAGVVQRGQQIGQVGNTGNARYTSAHVHFAIGSNANVFGDRGGSGDIRGDSSYWRARDKGGLIRNPTLTLDTITGERGIMAERGPELLAGREDTARMMAMSIYKPRVGVGYSQMAAAGMAAGGGRINDPMPQGGDVINVNGVGVDEFMRRINQAKHSQQLLRGVRGRNR